MHNFPRSSGLGSLMRLQLRCQQGLGYHRKTRPGICFQAHLYGYLQNYLLFELLGWEPEFLAGCWQETILRSMLHGPSQYGSLLHWVREKICYQDKSQNFCDLIMEMTFPNWNILLVTEGKGFWKTGYWEVEINEKQSTINPFLFFFFFFFAILLCFWTAVL